MNEMEPHIKAVAESDVIGLLEAQKHYGDSWKKRGGIGAFMMLARKWDRIENKLAKPAKMDDGECSIAPAYDIFLHAIADGRAEGLIDDIRDIRRYFLLVEAELRRQGYHKTKSRDEKMAEEEPSR